jgi:uncharacterized membrane protein
LDRVRNILALLRNQLWLLPALCTLLAAGLAYVLISYGDRLGPGDETEHWWLYSGEASTARDLLSSLLGGLMTMTSLVVSVTFVILTLAANQLGPRLISIFMGDRQIQAVLGLYIGTILYVIVVLRTLDDTLGSEGVPHLAVTAGSVLTILCLLALLFYVHKIAYSIIADNVVESVYQEFCSSLHNILPRDRDEERHDGGGFAAGSSWGMGLGTAGYLQVVDYDRLLALACEDDLRIEVKVRAGHYVLRQGEHVVVHGDVSPDRKAEKKIRSAFTVGAERTPAQDPEHGIRQLVEIATRALSPGTNDPFTAKAVIDRLGASFEAVFAAGLQPRVLRDEQGDIRVHADRSDIRGLLDAAFHPIRQAGAEHPAILIRMAQVIGDLAPAMRNDAQRNALVEELDRLAETAALGRFAPGDRQDIVRRTERARLAVVGRQIAAPAPAVGERR